MADIFVSYRRNDSAWPASLINERLAAVFGADRVFFDTVTIRPGENFREVLGAKVGACKVLLAVIAPRWLEILEQRLGDGNDFVRIEIAEGLRRDIRVIPVLIDGAKPPPEARLPDDLKPLAWHNAIPVRADTFRSDLDQLIGFLREFLDGPPPGTSEGRVKIGAKIIHGAPDGWFKPGAGKTEWFKDHEHGAEMVVVPAGEFIMGSPESEPERRSDEGPQQRVTMARPFAVSRFVVTRGQFAVFADVTDHKPEGGAQFRKGKRYEHDPRGSWLAPGFPQDDSHPVVSVSWHDAKAYAAWLAQVTRRPYRLLSEAEWEYCCRAGTTTPFWWGASITTAQANYDGGHVYKGGGSRGERRMATVPAGNFAVNPLGLYQVHGNVMEWCEDVWHGSYVGVPSDGSPRLQGGDASRRIVRGGCWYSPPSGLRSAFRTWVGSGRANDLGFRLARTL